MAISIWEPRYHDRKVLIAKYKVPKDSDIDIEIIKGAYRGKYHISEDVLKEADEDIMMSKAGNKITMVAIPLDKLERRDNDN